MKTTDSVMLAVVSEVLVFFLLGLGLCLLRDLVMFFAGVFLGKRIGVNVADLLFFVMVTVSTCLSFLLTTDGKIRVYLLLIELLGFLLWRFVLGRQYRRKIFHFSVQINFAFSKIFNAITALFFSFFQKIGLLFKKLFAFVKKIRLWMQNCLKNTCKKTYRGV